MTTNVNTTGAGSAHSEIGNELRLALIRRKDDVILAAEVLADLEVLLDCIRRCGDDARRAERLAEIARRMADEFCAAFETSYREVDEKIACLIATGAGSAHAEIIDQLRLALIQRKDDVIVAAEVLGDLAALLDCIRRCGNDARRAERLAEIARRMADEFCAVFEEADRNADAQLAAIAAQIEGVMNHG